VKGCSAGEKKRDGVAERRRAKNFVPPSTVTKRRRKRDNKKEKAVGKLLTKRQRGESHAPGIFKATKNRGLGDGEKKRGATKKIKFEWR